jgi:hypothetical protein
MSRASLVLMALFAACRPPGPNPESKPSAVDTGEPAAPADWRLIAEHPRAALMGVTGSGEDDVWAVGADDGEGGLVLNWDGAAWARVPNADRHDLWWSHAFSPDEVFAVGAGGTVLRGGRSGFTRMSTPGLGAQTLYGAWGSAPDDLWAVGGFAGRWGFLWHFDGEAWVEQPLPDDLPLSPEGELPALFKVWGRAADDVWAVGSHGTILHFDGAAWEVVPSGTDELLFTVHARNGRLAVVGPRTVLVEEGGAFTNVSPDGAGILQGVCVEDDGSIVISGQSGTMWVRDPAGAWAQQTNTTGVSPESLHAVWTAPSGDRWSAGGAVLSAALDQGVIVHQGAAIPSWTAPEPVDPGPAVCPDEAIDPEPGGSVARGWSEQILQAIRRDIPRPGVHARNLYHLSVAMWDAWAVYDEVADPMLGHPRVLVADPVEREEARATAISMAAYRVLAHRYPGLGQVGADVTAACLDAHLEHLGLDPADDRTTGDDPVAVGNRIGQSVIDTFADDGSNEAENYADTTGWAPLNPPLVVDQPGNDIEHPDDFQLLNLAAAETQNGIVLDSGLQSYIGAQWGQVTPFALPALGERDGAHAWIIPDAPYPSVDEPSTADEVLEVLRKHAALDATLPETIDISPGAYGNNPLGSNAGAGHPVNPVTGLPYPENIVPLGDFVRVLAEVWADGPKSETPPGHWNSLANVASDAMDPEDLVIAETGRALDRLGWDVHLYLGLNGALHDAAIAAWGLKRESLGARPISLIRWMADRGQRSDPSLPSYHPDGLPLEDGVVELITDESAAPGQRHHHLRWFIGEVAVRSWRGEPGDRANVATGVAWMRAREWFPYQRRTFVTPAFPGYVSGHSTFSRAAAELLTRLTGSPYFPGGLASYTAPAHAQLVFEDGPSVDVVLQWATYQDAADQAGQSRLWGGIHIWADDRYGRTIGHEVGHLAADAALPWFDGTAVVD